MKDSKLISTTDYIEVKTAADHLGVREWEVLKAIEILKTNNRELVYAWFRMEKGEPVGAVNTDSAIEMAKKTGAYLERNTRRVFVFDGTVFNRHYEMNNKQTVLDWAEDKNLLRFENRIVQFAKTVSEVGELGDALIRNNTEDVIDAIGDTVVTLIILANQCGLDIEDCLESSYQVIKNRTGKTNELGTFIKD